MTTHNGFVNYSAIDSSTCISDHENYDNSITSGILFSCVYEVIPFLLHNQSRIRPLKSKDFTGNGGYVLDYAVEMFFILARENYSYFCDILSPAVLEPDGRRGFNQKKKKNA